MAPQFCSLCIMASKEGSCKKNFRDFFKAYSMILLSQAP